MLILVKNSPYCKKFFWWGNSRNSLDRLSKQITKILKAEKNCKTVHWLMIIAQMEMKLSCNIYYQAHVEKSTRKIKIICVTHLKGKRKETEIMRFDKNTEFREPLREVIINSVIMSLEKMEIRKDTKERFLLRLENRKVQIKKNA
jgi:hypothetical protein